MIPKRIHYCWFGKGKKNALIKNCMKSWGDVLPGYEIKEWNESNSPMEHPFIKAAYAQKRWSKVANYVRLYALHEEGGIYFDTDIEVVKDFMPLLADKCFLGFQAGPREADWVGNAVIGAVEKHQYIKKCLDLTADSYFDHNEFLTGPNITTRILKQYGLQVYGEQYLDDIKLYPVEYFYPYSWREKYASECIKQNTYTIHHWVRSWHSPLQRVRTFIKRYL